MIQSNADCATLGHSNWIISFPLLDVTTSMQAGGLLLLFYYENVKVMLTFCKKNTTVSIKIVI